MSNSNKRDAPCRHCEERHVFCHTTCNKYAKWKDEHDKKVRQTLDKRIALQQASSFIIDQQTKGRKKYKK